MVGLWPPMTSPPRPTPQGSTLFPHRGTDAGPPPICTLTMLYLPSPLLPPLYPRHGYGCAGVVFSIEVVTANSNGVAVQTRAVMVASATDAWLTPARQLYNTLRTGTCDTILFPRAWNVSLVMQVSMPYLVRRCDGSALPSIRPEIRSYCACVS